MKILNFNEFHAKRDQDNHTQQEDANTAFAAFTMDSGEQIQTRGNEGILTFQEFMASYYPLCLTIRTAIAPFKEDLLDVPIRLALVKIRLRQTVVLG